MFKDKLQLALRDESFEMKLKKGGEEMRLEVDLSKGDPYDIITPASRSRALL